MDLEPNSGMSDKDVRIYCYAVYICVNSKENPNSTRVILEYEDNKIKVTTMNTITKEKKEELIDENCISGGKN